LIIDKLKKDYADKQVPQSSVLGVLARFLESPASCQSKPIEAGESFNDIATGFAKTTPSLTVEILDGYLREYYHRFWHPLTPLWKIKSSVRISQ
jgi:hypothetical protein